MSPMHGGMINEVVELQLAEEPFKAVVKVSYAEGDPFAAEEQQLRFLNESKLLPCPTPYVRGAKGERSPFAFLAMERLAGVNWGQADLSPAQSAEIESQLAEMLSKLHQRTGPKFGFWGDATHDRWLEAFEPIIHANRCACEGLMDPNWLRRIDALLARMPEGFQAGEPPEPRLVYGDVWSANVIVDRANGSWVVRGLVDPGLAYADVEYELAYIACFGSTGSGFFKAYERFRPMREGFEIRKRYYWLNTMLLHVRLFGDSAYIRHTQKVVDELERLWRG